jgi:hypothetical protein
MEMWRWPTERLKAHKNEGDNIFSSPMSNLADDIIISNLDCIGISVGSDASSVSKSVAALKCTNRVKQNNLEEIDRKTRLLKQEERNMLEEEELDKILLNNICIEIMEEVMDREVT